METLNKNNITGIAALLVHAAKIDEKYSDQEKNLIKDFIQSYLKDENKESILINAEEIEKNSNQLLSFTNIIKKNTEEIKSSIVEHLWKIIISDNSIVIGLVIRTVFAVAHDTEFALIEVIPVILCLFILPNICEL